MRLPHASNVQLFLASLDDHNYTMCAVNFVPLEYMTLTTKFILIINCYTCNIFQYPDSIDEIINWDDIEEIVTTSDQ